MRWGNQTGDSWTEDEEEYLRVNLDWMTFLELGEKLGRPTVSVWYKCKKLELSRSAEGEKYRMESFTLFRRILENYTARGNN